MRRLRMQQRPCWLLQRRPPLKKRCQSDKKVKVWFPLKVKRVSLNEAAQLEPHVCLAGVGGALVAGVNICQNLPLFLQHCTGLWQIFTPVWLHPTKQWSTHGFWQWPTSGLQKRLELSWGPTLRFNSFFTSWWALSRRTDIEVFLLFYAVQCRSSWLFLRL